MSAIGKPTLVYSSKYQVSFGGHVFPTEKYALTYQKIKEANLLKNYEVTEPIPASTEELLLVHLPDYVRDFMNFELSEAMVTSELPLNKEIRDFFLLTTGGTILAARESLQSGKAIHLGGGFHHAFPDHAEGFCYLNDPAIAIKQLKKEGRITRAALIDCDLHQGNGSAYIFRHDKQVFTFSIHQENLYPVKQKSDLDIGLDDFAEDKKYLDYIQRYVPLIYDRHQPDIVCYLAGADPFMHDKLGNLQISKTGLAERDKIVITEAVSRGIPIFVVLAGGYAYDTNDVADIHFQTAKALI